MEDVKKTTSWKIVILALALGLIALIASGLYTALTTRGVEKFQDKADVKKFTIFDAKTYEDLAERLQSPLPWLFHDHKLFVSRILIYLPKEKLVQPLDLSKAGYDMIPYGWKREYGFPVEDSNVAVEDFDKDGFSNFEEFQTETDPRDLHSSPPPILKLRMEKYQALPFQFTFKGYALNTDGSYDYQINVHSPKGTQTLFVKKGQRLEFEGEAWEVGEFRMKIAKKLNPTTQMDQEFDKSELDLWRAGFKGSKKTLVKGQVMDATESKAYFISLIPSESPPPPIGIGTVFVFRDEEYLLIAADNTGAAVKRLTDGKEFFVREITREEKASTGFWDEKRKKE